MLDHLLTVARETEARKHAPHRKPLPFPGCHDPVAPFAGAYPIRPRGGPGRPLAWPRFGLPTDSEMGSQRGVACLEEPRQSEAQENGRDENPNRNTDEAATPLQPIVVHPELVPTTLNKSHGRKAQGQVKHADEYLPTV